MPSRAARARCNGAGSAGREPPLCGRDRKAKPGPAGRPRVGCDVEQSASEPCGRRMAAQGIAEWLVRALGRSPLVFFSACEGQRSRASKPGGRKPSSPGRAGTAVELHPRNARVRSQSAIAEPRGAWPVGPARGGAGARSGPAFWPGRGGRACPCGAARLVWRSGGNSPRIAALAPPAARFGPAPS
jgi:hypothetical protein